jgi:hypothetical protein
MSTEALFAVTTAVLSMVAVADLPAVFRYS